MKYTVVKAWTGVPAGTIIERDKLHPALKAHVKPYVEPKDEADLQVATPGAKSKGSKKPEDETTAKDEGKRRGVIAKRLKELEIKFDGRNSSEELAKLLPEGELDKLFPAQ